MIGLVDYDLQTTSLVGLVPPNIEIMKLATYYKNEENTFCRLIDLKEQELSSYDKIYFFSEQEKYPENKSPYINTDRNNNENKTDIINRRESNDFLSFMKKYKINSTDKNIKSKNINN